MIRISWLYLYLWFVSRAKKIVEMEFVSLVFSY